MPITYLRQIVQQENLCLDGETYAIKSTNNASAKYVEGYYLFKDIRCNTNHWIFNDGFPSIVLFPDQGCEALIRTEDKEFRIQSGWVDGGIIKQSYVQYLKDLDYIFVIRFRPETFYRLFALSSAYFKDCPICSISSLTIEESLISRIFSTHSLETKSSIFESYLEAIDKKANNLGLIYSATALIGQAKGQITVKDLASNLGVNYKWLERHFSKNIGLTPKEYIQLQRFMTAYIDLQNQPNDLLNVAIANGYYDYNHYLKEFKRFSGSTPLEYTRIGNQH